MTWVYTLRWRWVSWLSRQFIQLILQNTSFSSAYTTTLPHLSFSPNKVNKFEDEIELSVQKQDIYDAQQLYSNVSDIDSDLVDLTLPEIPDLSSFSSLRDELSISCDQFNVSSNDPAYHLDLDESLLGTSMKRPSLDTLSSSSIQFRHTEVLHTDSLERNAGSLYLPQPDGLNSWTLFLSPTSLCSDEPSFSQARNSLAQATSDSGCRPGSSNLTHVRRSWRVSSSLPFGPFPVQEETSTQRYANEVLDRAFNGCNSGEANLVFGISEKDQSSVLGCLCPKSTLHGPQPESSVPSQARIYLAVKMVKKKMHHIFTKFSVNDIKSANDSSNSLRQSSNPGGIGQGRSLTRLCFRVCFHVLMY